MISLFDQKKIKSNLLEIILPLLLTLVLYPWQIHGYINPIDEGTFLAIAQALHLGKALYKEVWFQYGPLVALPLKLADIFGLLCIYFALLHFVSVRLLRLISAVAIWMIPLAAHTTTIPMAYRYGLPFLSLIFWPSPHAVQRGNYLGRPLISGLIGGISFFNSQEVAVAAIVSGFVVFLFHSNRRTVLPQYLYGLIISFIFFSVFIGFSFGLFEFIQSTIVETAQLVSLRKVISLARPWTIPPSEGVFSFRTWQVWAEFFAFISPLVIALIGLIYCSLTKEKNGSSVSILMLGMALFVLIFSIPAWGRTDRWHVYYSFSPVILLLGFVIDTQFVRISRVLPLVLFFFAFFVFFIAAPNALADVKRKIVQKEYSRVLDLNRGGGVKIPFGQANAYEQLNLYAEKNISRTEPILMFPYDGAFYFLSDRGFPCRFPLLIEAVSEMQQKEISQCIEDSGLKWIVLDRENNSFDGISVEKRLSIVLETIKKHFSLVHEIGPFIFLRRST